MSRVVALGESARVAGYALAGVNVLETDAAGALDAWARLPEDTGLLLLTDDAANSLAGELARAGRLLWAVIPS